MNALVQNMSKSTPTRLSIVIPTYNEEEIILDTLRSIESALPPDVRDTTEIIVVDDGNDRLAEVLRSNKGVYNFQAINVMRNESRAGKGRSIKLGFDLSKGQTIGFIDADLSVRPSLISVALKHVEDGANLCVASRYGNRVNTDHSILTSIVAHIFRFASRYIFFRGQPIYPDTQCGFKFFSRDVASELYADLLAHDGLADLEILVKAFRRGLDVKQILVERTNHRKGKRQLSSIFFTETLMFLRLLGKYGLR